MPILSIIILTYNSSEYVEKCLSSLFKFYRKHFESQEFELVVADNASTDGTVEKISNIKYPSAGREGQISNIKIIQNKENFGFAKGINLASKNALGRYLLFLNPDTGVLDGNIGGMVDYMEKNHDVGVIGGRIVGSDGQGEGSAGKFYSLLNLLFLTLGLENALGVRFSPKEESLVDFVSGGFMIVRRDLFKELGGFDKNFFMYVEDMELCYRIKRKGYKVMFLPFSSIRHVGQGSSNRTFAIVNIYKGILYFYKKHNSRLEYFLARLLLSTKAIIAISLGTFIGNQYLKKTYIEALRNIKY